MLVGWPVLFANSYCYWKQKYNIIATTFVFIPGVNWNDVNGCGLVSDNTHEAYKRNNTYVFGIQDSNIFCHSLSYEVYISLSFSCSLESLSCQRSGKIHLGWFFFVYMTARKMYNLLLTTIFKHVLIWQIQFLY